MDFEIRKVRNPQGRKKLSAERAAYFQLMQQGVSNEDACRIVGVNSKTGRRWRDGRRPSGRNKTASPVRPVVPPSVSSSRCLSQDERIYIADRIREKAPVRAIAAELGRSPSNVSREIRRNRTTGTTGQWHHRPYAAQARADSRCPRPRPQAPEDPPEPRAAGLRPGRPGPLVEPGTDMPSSEAQFPERPETHVVHETAYQALYVQGRGELRREPARALRSGRTRRRPQRQTRSRQPRFRDPMAISERPSGRRRFGDRHPRRTRHPVRDAPAPARLPQRRTRPGRPGGHRPDAARTPGPLSHLGPGRRDGPPQELQHLFLPSTSSVGVPARCRGRDADGGVDALCVQDHQARVG